MSDRVKVQGLDPATGAPGQVPTINAAGDAVEYATPAGGGTGVESIVPGPGIDVDSSDPANPVVSATGGGGSNSTAWMPLTTVVAGVPELVWDTDDSLIPTEVPL